MVYAAFQQTSADILARQLKLQLENMCQEQERTQKQLDSILTHLSITQGPTTGMTGITLPTTTAMPSVGLAPPVTNVTEATGSPSRVSERMWTVPERKPAKRKEKEKEKELTLGNGTTIAFMPMSPR
jgi:hypothetical protein